MNYIKNFLDYCNNTIWKDETPNEEIIKISNTAFEDMKKSKDKVKKIFRICGQSGSGKTTQLLFSLNEALQSKGMNPVIIAVRNFAPYHPHYNELLSKYGKAEIREITNGFALKLLCLTLCKFVESGYFIVMDITLLSPEFEKIVLSLLKENQYETEYLLMSVSKNQSDSFILKRMNEKSTESNRIVYNSSSDFFYNTLPCSLEYLANNDKNSIISVWSTFQKEPIYYGIIKDSFLPFSICRQKNMPLIFNEDELKDFKINFFSKNLTF